MPGRESAAAVPIQIAVADDRWHAHLELEFQARGDKTVIACRRHTGPLTLQKPFYPESVSVCHVYLLHPPGGIVGGDALQLDVKVRAGAHVLLTTPAAGKFYRCSGKKARLRQTLQVHADAVLEWLPQETIVFAGSDADACTRVELESGGRFIGWETACLGRPAGNENFDSGYYRQRFEIWRDDKPILIERGLFCGGSDMLTAAWGMQGYPVSATMIATPADETIRSMVCSQVEFSYPGLFAVTLINDVLICRYLGQQAEHARNVFVTAWRLIRPQMLQREACVPRIWAT